MTDSYKDERTLPIFLPRIIDDLLLTLDEFRVYVHLSGFAEAETKAMPSRLTIGMKCFGIDAPNATDRQLAKRARQAIDGLVAQNVIGKNERLAADGSHKSYQYSIIDLDAAGTK